MARTSLSRKIFYRFIIVIALVGGATLYLTLDWFSRNSLREAREMVGQDLFSLKQMLASRMEAYSNLLAAVASPLRKNDVETMIYGFQTACRVQEFDFGGYFSARTGQGFRIRTLDPSDRQSFFYRYWRMSGAKNGYILLPLEELARENLVKAGVMRRTVETIPPEGPPFDRGRLLAMVAWSEFSRPGKSDDKLVFYAGRIVAFDSVTFDRFGEILFGAAVFEGKPAITLTLFQNGRRIATNVLDERGRRALGTSISPEIYREVVEQGKAWSGRAWVVDRWYLGEYEPLRDVLGRTVGTLYVGVLEDLYRDKNNRLVRLLLGIYLGGTLVVVAISWFLSRLLARPLKRLLKATDSIRDGALDGEAACKAVSTDFSEAEELIASFRAMMQSIRERDASLHEVNASLEQTNGKLEQANRNYMEMLSFVTHELSNMVGVLMLDAHALKETVADRLNAEEQESMTSLLQQLDRFKDMIRNYLDLSRIEKDRMVVNKTEMNLYWDVLQFVGKELSGRVEGRGMHLEIAPETEQVDLVADPNLLRVVCYNLMGNAVKYGRDGGRIRCHATRETEGTVTVHVWNEGEGIRRTDLARLGEKFFRPIGDAGRKVHGSGLGLYITQEIVERHGGFLKADSAEGEWAEFTVTLPAPPPPAP